ncbi:MAG: hypothetical protein O3B86_02945, partial [Planctomycetota bacterium]|nr:hypothetical protein [Planctomycetota bacterium]
MKRKRGNSLQSGHWLIRSLALRAGGSKGVSALPNVSGYSMISPHTMSNGRGVDRSSDFWMPSTRCYLSRQITNRPGEPAKLRSGSLSP